MYIATITKNNNIDSSSIEMLELNKELLSTD